MLSRLSFYGSSNLAKCLVKFQPVSALATSAASESTPAKQENVKNPGAGHPPEFPHPTSKRDFVNFPRPILNETIPPVRFGFIPESWFNFFYPKTGYTGPYMFMLSVGTYIYSKEIFVYDHNATHLYATVIALIMAHYKLGPMIKSWYEKSFEEERNGFNEFQEDEKKLIRKDIDYLKDFENSRSDIVEVYKGKTESVYLQMEMHFRERLLAVHKMVKERLDCQAELESAESRVAQRNLYDYVMRNVMKSITPDLEKNALQMCINDLNALAAKA